MSIQGQLTFEGDATFARNSVTTDDSDEQGKAGAISNTGSGTILFKGKLTMEGNFAEVYSMRCVPYIPSRVLSYNSRWYIVYYVERNVCTCLYNRMAKKCVPQVLVPAARHLQPRHDVQVQMQPKCITIRENNLDIGKCHSFGGGQEQADDGCVCKL